MMGSMMRRAMLGDGSTLNLDFTTMTATADLTARGLTFTRGSNGTRINASGFVETMSNNVARFDHDPTTGAPQGLLIEGQATNLMFRSQEIATSPWFNAGTMTVSNIGSGSPANDATSNVVTWTNGTGAGGAWLQQNVAVSAGALVVGTAYTWSVWLKNRGGRRVNVFAVLQGVTGNREVRVDFGVSPPTVTSTVATGWTSIQTPTIVSYPNGWYKITTGGTLPASVTSVNFGFSNADAVPASGTNGFEAWGYQLETGSGASSYIPTGASQATRVADECVMTGTNFSSWYGTPTSASVLYEGTIVQPSDGFRRIAVFSSTVSSSTVANFSLMVSGNQNNRPALNSFINSANNVDAYVPLAGAVTNGTQFRLAARVESGNHRISRAGQSATSSYSTAPGFPQGIVALSFGSDGALMPSHWIRQLKYYPFSLTNAQMDAWSA
jgi:hypothetical protein